MSTFVHCDSVTSPSSSTNLEPLSAFYSDMNGAASSYASLDTSVLHNGNPSIRLGPDNLRGTREVDGTWINVKPGDHIQYSVWAKTSPSSTQNTVYSGARIGCDLYSSTSAGYGVVDTQPHPFTIVSGVEVSGDNGDGLGLTTTSQFMVPWNHDWTLLTWDFYIPSAYFSSVYTQQGVQIQSTLCKPVQIDSMVVWLDARELTDGPYAWFADPVLMVNPSASSTVDTTTSSSAIKVTSIFSQQAIVESRFTLPIILAMQNISNSTETVTAQLVATSNLSPSSQVYTIYNGPVTIDGGSSLNLNCFFDATNFPIGNYTITAYLSSSYGLTTTLCTAKVGVTYFGDLNGDFTVNFNDLKSFVQDYTTNRNGGQCNPAADFNHDGKIDFTDLKTFISAYNSYWNQ